jgi:hypothetical protein
MKPLKSAKIETKSLAGANKALAQGANVVLKGNMIKFTHFTLKNYPLQ